MANLSSTATAPQSVSFKSENEFGKKYALTILTSLFFSWGFLTCLNDILIPHLKAFFTLSYAQAVLVQFVFFSSYLLVSIPASWFCEKVGYSRGMSIGLVVAAAGAFGFLAAAEYQMYSIFLGSLFVLASGITLLQVAANPYVTLIGDPAKASSRLTWAGAFNSLGTTVAPIVGSVMILSSMEVTTVQKPYFILGCTLVLLSVVMAWLKLPEIKTGSKAEVTLWKDMLTQRELMLGALGIFTYVGAEVSIGSFLVSWLGEGSVGAMIPEQAGKYVAFYWGGAMVGRFIGTPLLAKYAVNKVSRLFVAGALLCVVVSALTQGWVSVVAILSVGLFNSILFPVIFAETLNRVKRGTERASGVLCSAIIGGALIPVVQGLVADGFSLRVSFVTPLICYLYLIWFVGRS
ncbi:MAG: sugar MFS transporter [Xanthomonadaceae bacterium]|nr:sugar MFS transporter [Xanthomonadaceae bacterium]